jgi:Cytochrome b(C-terminal)/b6/petD
MHGHVPYDVFLHQIAGFLGSYYLLLALMNGVAAFLLWHRPQQPVFFRLPGVHVPVTSAFVWLLVALAFLLIAPLAYSGDPRVVQFITVPAGARAGINRLMNPTIYIMGTFFLLLFLFVFRRFFAKPTVAWTMLNLSLLLMGMSIPDPNFAQIVTKPDNVPIVAMIFLLGFFTWLATYRAVVNDERLKQGLEPLEMLDSEKVLVWPDLVYTELICMVVVTAVLLFWGIALQAPLEDMANPVKTPNPSKAPWYFLGLQEMLVYFDPWMAGVVLPSLVLAGLMAIPYIDFNKAGNGYYTIDQRKFAYVMFQFGFLVLWVTLIVMGTFLRGPNWNFFGPYETWDAHKVEALNNRDLSEFFWVDLMRSSRPRAPEGSGDLTKIGYAVVKEAPGILLTIGYFTLVPPLLVVMSRFFQHLFIKMGFLRYMVMTNLLLFMALLPIKMLLRWTVNLKYFISMPEYMLNL